MGHLPSGGADHEGLPIIIEGKPKKITITRPHFFDQDQIIPGKPPHNVEQIENTHKPGGSNTGNGPFSPCTITKIIVTIGGGAPQVQPVPNGKCTIEVYYDHK